MPVCSFQLNLERILLHFYPFCIFLKNRVIDERSRRFVKNELNVLYPPEKEVRLG